MKFARARVDNFGWTGHRLLVAEGTGPWIDLRAWARDELVHRGANEERANDLAAACVPGSLSQALQGGDVFLDLVDRAVADAEGHCAWEGALTYGNAADPASYRDFMVFEEHFRFGYEWQGKPVPEVMYELPVCYAGDPRSFIGPFDEIPWPSYSERLDYELELGIVLGRTTSDVSPDQALGHVLGLTILNDVSARDIQAREMTGGLGPSKGKHFACVAGPMVVSLDELSSERLGMRVRVNGDVWCETTTDRMVWSVAEIVSWASQGERLPAGTLLGSGTCNGGSSIELDRDLSPGDDIELSIEGLGMTRNRLGQPSSTGTRPRARTRTQDGHTAEHHFLT
ncbi:fumarylacetoacetate hydrolase family protein [Streptomyces sp. NPDC047072]|uniref:fumarylacetoacetate hydrolase family protein n=1 Tax=Streptomyces sp. NPDC047072 TaxID=3154809 RepID=UPI0033C7D3E4